MKTKPIHKIKEMLQSEHIDDNIIEQLRGDSRKGVQRLLAIYDKQKMKEEKLKKELMLKKHFEDQFRLSGNDLVAGVDEAGRGPLAGPVVAAAVILPRNFEYLGIDDSKQISEVERNVLFKQITENAISYSISVVQAQEIDQLNIFEATKQAMTRALESLDPIPQIALIDAVKLAGLNFPTQSIIKGDEKSLAIAAASILAKVTRDKLMVELHKKYPAYCFHKNKGYGTKQHLTALEKYGPTGEHRKSFSPVQMTLRKEFS